MNKLLVWVPALALLAVATLAGCNDRPQPEEAPPGMDMSSL